jgi:hypothetical protein
MLMEGVKNRVSCCWKSNEFFTSRSCPLHSSYQSNWMRVKVMWGTKKGRA